MDTTIFTFSEHDTIGSLSNLNFEEHNDQVMTDMPSLWLPTPSIEASRTDQNSRGSTAIMEYGEDQDMEAPQNPPSKKDWKRFKPIITQLYLHDGKTLREVKDIMLDTYKFDATLKMYSGHRRDWKLNKTFRGNDIVAMETVARERTMLGKETIFERHGRVLDPARISRSAKRKRKRSEGHATSNNGTKRPDFVTSITFRSPKIAPKCISDPPYYAKFETILQGLDRYIRISLSSGRAVVLEGHLQWPMWDPYDGTPDFFARLLSEGLVHSESGRSQAAMFSYRKASLLLESMSHCSDPLAWLQFFQLILLMHQTRSQQIGEMILKHMKNMLSTKMFCFEVTLKSVMIQLAGLGLDDINNFMDTICCMNVQLWSETFSTKTLVGLKYLTDILYRIPYDHRVPLIESSPGLREAVADLRQASNVTQLENKQHFLLLCRNITVLQRFGYHREAMLHWERLLHTLSMPCSIFDDHHGQMFYKALVWYQLARTQLLLEEWHNAKSSLIEAEGILVELDDYFEVSNQLKDVYSLLNWISNLSPIADGDQKWAVLLQSATDELEAELIAMDSLRQEIHFQNLI